MSIKKGTRFPAGNRSRAKVLHRKLEILKSAASAFRKRGYHAVTMDEIAEALLMTKGMLYYYFPSKHDLLYFCQDSSCDRLLQEAGHIWRLDLRADGKLYRLIVAQVLCMLDELYGAAAHLEISALPPARRDRIVAKRDRYERVTRELIEEGIHSKVFSPCDPKLIAFAILGAVNWTAKWYQPSGPFPPEGIAHGFARLLVRGLLAPGVKPRFEEIPA